MLKLTKLWHSHAKAHCTGYLHHPSKGFLQGNALARHFASLADEAALIRELSQANGCFALIINLPEGVFAAVDKLRSLPLFWDMDGNLADKSESLAPLTAQDLKSCAADILAEYLITGYVTGSDTLHPQLKQIPAGHYLLLQEGQSPQLKRYYRFQHQEVEPRSLPDWIQLQHQTHLEIAKSTLESLDGRVAVIPLSGGYDSRLLAYLFKTLKYDHIITFSYDSPRHRESRISRCVAQHLGLPHLFIPHTHRSWYQAFWSQSRRDFYRYAVNASSSAHIQDWLAVNELQERKLIPEDSVFIPGHSADFLQGSHLPLVYAKKQSFTREELLCQILAKHYRLWPAASDAEHEGFKARILAVIQAPSSMDVNEAADLFEYHDLQERQAKFILNSLRVYESFGYEWRLPLWDQRLMDYWAAVPLPLRLGRKLWQLYAQEHLPIPIPVFTNPPIAERVLDKSLRLLWGEVRNVRYGRFADRRSFTQYVSLKAAAYLRDDLDYPSFVDGRKAVIRCDMNALQALISLWEL
jgi:asparagine synthase (glutamine-hydrolysing)